MITIKDWDLHCTDDVDLFCQYGGEIYSIPRSSAIAYDTTLNTYCLCLWSNNITFDEIYKTRQDCAKAMSNDILRSEGVE
jgi:hypothetical protein